MLLALVLTAAVHAEEPSLPPVQAVPTPTPETWEAIRRAAVHRIEQRRKTQIAGMSVLVGWSVANLGAGAVGWATADETEWVRFHQMSMAWGAVNLAIAVPGLVGALRDDPARYDLAKVLRTDTGDRVTFGVNAGLDVGYVATGAWLWERGERTGDPTLIGFGRSLVLQGGFLLLLDATMLGLHTAQGHRLLVLPELGEVYGLKLVVTN
jgi:hypothetical protein